MAGWHVTYIHYHIFGPVSCADPDEADLGSAEIAVPKRKHVEEGIILYLCTYIQQVVSLS